MKGIDRTWNKDFILEVYRILLDYAKRNEKDDNNYSWAVFRFWCNYSRYSKSVDRFKSDEWKEFFFNDKTITLQYTDTQTKTDFSIPETRTIRGHRRYQTVTFDFIENSITDIQPSTLLDILDAYSRESQLNKNTIDCSNALKAIKQAWWDSDLAPNGFKWDCTEMTDLESKYLRTLERLVKLRTSDNKSRTVSTLSMYPELVDLIKSLSEKGWITSSTDKEGNSFYHIPYGKVGVIGIDFEKEINNSSITPRNGSKITAFLCAVDFRTTRGKRIQTKTDFTRYIYK